MMLHWKTCDLVRLPDRPEVAAQSKVEYTGRTSTENDLRNRCLDVSPQLPYNAT